MKTATSIKIGALAGLTMVIVGVACTSSSEDVSSDEGAIRRQGETTDTSAAFDPDDCDVMLDAAVKAVQKDRAEGKATKWILSEDEIKCLSTELKLQDINVNNAAAPSPYKDLLRPFLYTAKLGAQGHGGGGPGIIAPPPSTDPTPVTACDNQPLATKFPNVGATVKKANGVGDRAVCAGLLRDLNEFLESKSKFVELLKDNVEILAAAEGTQPSFSADRILTIPWNGLQNDQIKKSILGILVSKVPSFQPELNKLSTNTSIQGTGVDTTNPIALANIKVSAELLAHAPTLQLYVNIDRLYNYYPAIRTLKVQFNDNNIFTMPIGPKEVRSQVIISNNLQSSNFLNIICPEGTQTSYNITYRIQLPD